MKRLDISELHVHDEYFYLSWLRQFPKHRATKLYGYRYSAWPKKDWSSVSVSIERTNLQDQDGYQEK